jgi:prophage regulatory protein
MARLLSWPQLKERIPFTRQYLLRLEQAGLFPRRRRVGQNRIAWLESEIDDWILSRPASNGHDEPEASQR